MSPAATLPQVCRQFSTSSMARAHGAVAKLPERDNATFSGEFTVLPSSINSLRLMSSITLRAVPPALAVSIGAYLLSAHLGAKPAPEPRVVVEDDGGVAFAPPADVIAAAHDAARVPAASMPTFEPRQRDVAAAEPAAPAPLPARAKAMRQASAKQADANVTNADKATPLPPAPPLQIADATPPEPVAEPQPARVLGVPVPRFVSRTGEKVANVADAMRPSRLLSATWEFGKQAANKAASAVGAIVPESRR
jgi:hypothetical protein